MRSTAVVHDMTFGLHHCSFSRGCRRRTHEKGSATPSLDRTALHDRRSRTAARHPLGAPKSPDLRTSYLPAGMQRDLPTGCPADLNR
jgi:hypothetical protein